MSNDLLFSIIPRNNRVEAKTNSGVTRVKKDSKIDRINEDDKDKQKEEQRADQEAVQQRHGKVVDKEQGDKTLPDDDENHLDLYV